VAQHPYGTIKHSSLEMVRRLVSHAGAAINRITALREIKETIPRASG
jgi:hypothetical protein